MFYVCEIHFLGTLNERLYIMKNNYCQILSPDHSILYLSLFLSVSITFPLYLPVYSLSLSLPSSHYFSLSPCHSIYYVLFRALTLYLCLSVCLCVCVSLSFFLPVNVGDLIYVFTCLVIYFLSISLYHRFPSLPI